MIIEVFFRNFYRNSARLQVDNVETREFAFQTFRGGFVRHKSFKTVDELAKFLVEKTPKHLYHSSARYRNPSEEVMDNKGWLGADLVFDIDGDHLNTEACRGVEIITIKCLEDAREEANKLIDTLRQELALEPSRVAFSGHRGFHIYVSESEVLTLGQRERRELVNFLKAVGFEREHFVKRHGRRSVVIYEEEPTGSLLRIKKGVEDARYLRIEVDEVVTQDVHRLMRVPGSLNGKTGLVAVPLTVRDLDSGVEQILKRAVAFDKGYLKFLFHKPAKGEVLFEELEVARGSVKTLPTQVAVYLELQGYGKILD